MIRRFLLSAALIWTATTATAEEVKMAVTTSFHNSGLADVLLPAIQPWRRQRNP